eukprot:173521-Amphidinium_carterae.1
MVSLRASNNEEQQKHKLRGLGKAKLLATSVGAVPVYPCLGFFGAVCCRMFSEPKIVPPPPPPKFPRTKR